MFTLLPAPAHAGTYAFSLGPGQVALAPDVTLPAGYLFNPPVTIEGNPSGRPLISAGTSAAASVALPVTAAFVSLAGTVQVGTGAARPVGLVGRVVAAAPDGSAATVWQQTLIGGYASHAFAVPGFAKPPDRVGIAMSSAVTAACGGCGISLQTLSGTISDTQPPTVSADSAQSGTAIATRTLSVSWSLTDTAAGPGDVFVETNGLVQPAPLRVAPAADTTLLTGQWSGGAATVTATSLVTLPDQDGTYTIAVLGRDGVGNATLSAPFTVTLDRAAPVVTTTVPAGWCGASCPITIHATDSGSGINMITATIGGTPIAIIPPAAHTPDATWRLTAPAGLQGAVVLHVAVSDAAGNTTTTDTPMLISTEPPRISILAADPQSRTVRIHVTDPSGVVSASARIGSQLVVFTTDSSAAAGTMTTRIPTVGFPTNLDAGVIAVRVTDAAGNSAAASGRFRSRGGIRLTIATATRRVATGTRILVTGRAALPDGTRILVRTASRDLPALDRSVVARVHAGRYRATLAPIVSGQLRAWWAGDASTRAASTTSQMLIVDPRITARFRLRRDHGVVIGASTRGVFAPNVPVAFTLVWQARSVTGQWYAICATTDAVTVAGGRFRGTCHLPGLAPGVWLRLAFSPSGSTLLGPASSPPVRVIG